MSDPGQIFHNSGTPPLIYYKGNEYIGGAVIPKIETIGIYYDFRESLEMQYVGEYDKEIYDMFLSKYLTTTPQVNKFTRDENGLQLSNSNYNSAYIRLPFLGYREGYDTVIEFETGDINISDSIMYNDIMVYCNTSSNYSNAGILAYRGNGGSTHPNRWTVSVHRQNNLSSYVLEKLKDSDGNDIRDLDYFNNCVVKIVSSPKDSRGLRYFKNNEPLNPISNSFLDIGRTFLDRKFDFSLISFGTTNSGNYPAHPMAIKWFKEYYEPIPEEYIL